MADAKEQRLAWLSPFRPYLGPLGVSALAMLAVSGLTTAHKAATLAPAGERVLGFPVYQVFAVLIALAIVVGVARLAALADDLRRRDAHGLAFLAVILGLVLAAADAGLSGFAIADARAGVMAAAEVPENSRELEGVRADLVADRADLAVLDAPAIGYVGADPAALAAKRQAIADAQRVLGIYPDGDWGSDTQVRMDARKPVLEREIATGEDRERELVDLIAAGVAKAVPEWVQIAVPIGVEAYVVIILFGVIRAQPPEPVQKPVRRSRAKTKREDEMPAAAENVVRLPVKGHPRSNTKNGVPKYERRPRGGELAAEHSRKNPRKR